jgi:hypothetical protein
MSAFPDCKGIGTRCKRMGVIETLQDAIMINTLRGIGSLGLVLEFSPYMNFFEASGDFQKIDRGRRTF